MYSLHKNSNTLYYGENKVSNMFPFNVTNKSTWFDVLRSLMGFCSNHLLRKSNESIFRILLNAQVMHANYKKILFYDYFFIFALDNLTWKWIRATLGGGQHGYHCVTSGWIIPVFSLVFVVNVNALFSSNFVETCDHKNWLIFYCRL